MSVKSKHGAGGEYCPEWRPKASLFSNLDDRIRLRVHPKPEEPPPEPPAPPVDGAPPPPARPAWRVVHKRGERKERTVSKTTPAPAPPVAPTPELPRPNLPAWAQWRRE
jgi:hypothetical protein